MQRDGTRRQERLDADVDCPALDRVSSPMQFLFEDEHVKDTNTTQHAELS